MLRESKIKEIFAKKSKIFKNKTALQPDFVPREILARETEITILAEILKDALNMEAPSNIFIYGDTGVGKTVITRYTLNLLLKEAEDRKCKDKIKAVYVNCKTVGTECQALGEIINTLSYKRVPSKGKGWGKHTYYDTLREILNENGGVNIVILDEVDELAEDAEDILYNLSRTKSSLGVTNAQVSLIGISNKIEFYEKLDSRIKSSMCQREIFVNPYDAKQLQEILVQRSHYAFFDDVIEDGVINYCAAIAAQEHGDARKAIDLLRASGEIAEKEATKRVTEEHMKKAQIMLELNRTEELIKGFTLQKKIVLLSLLKNEQSNINNNTQSVYDAYKKLCKQMPLEILSQRRVAELISELETAGMISFHILYQGRYGRKRTIDIKSAYETIEKALFQDELITELKNVRLMPQKKLLHI